MGILLCVLCITYFSKLLNCGVWRRGEFEGTLGLLLDLNTTRSGFPTDIYIDVSITNRWYFTFSVDTVATFLVTLHKICSTAVCSKGV